jgi:hypothetical protein
MAVTAKQFGEAVYGQYSATAARRIDWVGDTIKVTLHTATYTPDQDAHNFYDDLTNELSTGGGYTSGGLALTNKTLVYDSTTNRTRLKADPSVWTSATFGPFRIAVVRKDTGTAGTSPLLTWVDFGADAQVANGTFTITWDATDGVFYHAVA